MKCNKCGRKSIPRSKWDSVFGYITFRKCLRCGNIDDEHSHGNLPKFPVDLQFKEGFINLSTDGKGER